MPLTITGSTLSSGRAAYLRQSDAAASNKNAAPDNASSAAAEAVISEEGRAAAQTARRFSKMETAAASVGVQSLAKAAKEQAGQLTINWNAVVDPHGKIYAKTYAEALVGQYQKAESAIRSYYMPAHRENLTFDNPYNHILSKYKNDLFQSPYFRADLSKAERDMAFAQERALLWGGRLNLNDPFALASSGGVQNLKDADRIARQAAQDKINALIAERQKATDTNEV